MNNKEHRYRDRPAKRRENAMGGLILLAIGGLLLARQVGAELPAWLFTWPMILIVVGLFVGVKTQFRDFGWLILIGLGTFFLLDRVENVPVRPYILPVVVILAGLFFLARVFLRKRPDVAENSTSADSEPVSYIPDGSTDDVMELVSVFGSAKRVILSKNFKGGEVVSVFGSAEINLTNADFNGRLVLEIVQIFGGAKIIVPPHWEVQAKTAAVFGGIEDKRSIQQGTPNPEKVVVIEGVTIFGGVTIASY